MAEIKVTDKRMFTPDGRLRDESVVGDEPLAAAEAGGEEAPVGVSVASPPLREEPPQAEGAGARLEIPGTPEGLGGPSFYDLLGVLAEPISLYLGDLELPGGESAENLDMARLHIDLLDVLRRRTMGNLAAQESAVLDDLLYRSRLRYVQKRG